MTVNFKNLQTKQEWKASSWEECLTDEEKSIWSHLKTTDADQAIIMNDHIRISGKREKKN